MIYFITDKKHDVIDVDNILKVIDSSTGVLNLELFLLNENNSKFGFDLEATGLDAYISEILLYIVGNKETQFVIDWASMTYEMFETLTILKEREVLGQNLKYDIKLMKVKYNFKFNKIFDTMIAEQRLTQHDIPDFLKQGYYRLDTIIERRLGYKSLDKATRLEFVGVNKDTFVFNNRHVQYAAGDVEPLFDLYDIYQKMIDKYKLRFLLEEIEFPLIKELAYAELEGFKLDVDAWREIIAENKKIKAEKEIALDNEFKRLRDTLLSEEERFVLKGGRFDRTRVHKKKEQSFDLFGEMIPEVKIKIDKKTGKKKKAPADKKAPYINWGSADQLVDIFAKLKQPLPNKWGQYLIPKVNKKYKTDKTDITTGEGAINAYLIENPDSVMKTLINLLIDYREVATQLNTFGENFIDFINPVSGKIHTIFRQCDAITGRLQSGNTKEKYFNSQNIPAQKKFREAFQTDDGYSILTIDLSGAEVVIMADKAKDQVLYDMAIVNDDAHSPIAQECWRNIGKHRMKVIFNKMSGEIGSSMDDRLVHAKYDKEYTEAILLSNININKKENKDKRTAFKSVTFGTVYGMYKKKCAKTLNISEEEAQIVLDTIKRMIPKTFAMVEANAQLATYNGYLVLNERTNSKIWYPEVGKARSNHEELDFMVRVKIEGSARNAPIQATQADMIKESIVEIAKMIKEKDLDAKLLISVHDELVYKFNDEIIDLFPGQIKELLLKTCNKYLSFITMEAEYNVRKSWTK